MRKITQQAVAAFMANTPFSQSNTSVEVTDTPTGSETTMRLWGNSIAKRYSDGSVMISNADWFTNTTKERLNGLPGVSIVQKRGDWYLNGEFWGGQWIEVKLK